MKVYYKRLPVLNMDVKFMFKSEYDKEWQEGLVSANEIMQSKDACMECLIEKVIEKTYPEKLDLEDVT
jgi:hypothetical protein